jgi:LysM repeat protein
MVFRRIAMRPGVRFLLTGVVAAAILFAAVQPAHAEARVHIVQPGDNLFRIALKYGVTVEAIQAANGLTDVTIYVGQVLVIPDSGAPPVPAATQPASAPPSAAPPAAPPADGVHVVQPGETLFRIGLKYNVSWTAIQSANGLAGTKIYAGQRLVIPGASAAPAQSPPPEATPTPPPAAPTETPPPTDTPAPAPTDTPAPAAGNVVHTVQAGETLFKIGLKYNISWTAIQAANGLADTRIYTGQSLVIPDAASAPQSAPEVAAPAPPPGSGKRFVVDLSEQRLYAYEGDTLVRTTLVSTGTWRYPTVTGTYSVYLRYVSADMRGPGYYLPNVPYVMYFYKGYGLHGTYWHNNFGTPMSHGCVNMPTAEAEWAYFWSDYGTPVIVQP